MFEDVGSKIQRLAKIIFFLCVVVGGFAFLFSLVSYFDNADYLEYATVYGGAGFRYSNLEEAGNAAYTALIVLKSSIAAIILSIIGCLPLYGFGIIVEKAENSPAASKVEAVISEEKDEIQ